jgi:hypothetical protein
VSANVAKIWLFDIFAIREEINNFSKEILAYLLSFGEKARERWG